MLEFSNQRSEKVGTRKTCEDEVITEDYLLTYCMKQSPSWEVNRFSAIQEMPRILWNPMIHYRIHKCLPPVPVLRITED